MFVFKFDKAIQAVAYLLRREPSREMNYMRLLKILYIADRESIKLTGRPITGDRVIAMKQGPVLGNILDLIKGIHLRSPEWSMFIQRDEYKIRLIAETGLPNLSRFDILTLERVAEEHRSLDEWDLVEFTHNFPEWRKNDPGDSKMKKIPFPDIFEALGRTTDPEIEEEAMEDRAFARLFGG
ncbi:MAG: Panacea domain-containing protein [Candidatus Latescibacter sp.]|nr:Panacea domain-containing protein [Candidatus Latescibacter sp.]